MEHDYRYHGKTLDDQAYAKAMAELGLEPSLERYKKMRTEKWDYPNRKFSFSIAEEGFCRVI